MARSTSFHGRVAIAAAISLGACVNPSTRIASALTDYGLDARQSQCVGDRLEANLSIGQLQQLGRAARSFREGDQNPQRLTPSDFVRVSSRIEDPQVPIEVAKAAVNCNLLASALGR